MQEGRTRVAVLPDEFEYTIVTVPTTRALSDLRRIFPDMVAASTTNILAVLTMQRTRVDLGALVPKGDASL